MRESELQTVCIEYLTYLEKQGKLWFTRINVAPTVYKSGNTLQFRRMSKGAKTGIPDILAFHGKKTYWIELKGDKGRQSKTQKEFENAVNKFTYDTYIIVRDFKQLKELIK